MAGTIGHKLMAGKPTKIDLDKDTHIDVRCQVPCLSPALLMHNIVVFVQHYTFSTALCLLTSCLLFNISSG